MTRQLQNAPANLKIEARGLRGHALAAQLSQVREEPGVLYPDPGKEIRQFEIALTRNMGLKRDASKGSFVGSVMFTAEEFYRDVLQHLRPWKPGPPKLKKTEERPPQDEASAAAAPEPMKAAIESAHEEMRTDTAS